MSSSAVAIASGSAQYVPLPDNLYHTQYMVLKNSEQHKKFHAHCNEMFLNKKGRELFPKLDIEFVNLQLDTLYCVSVKMYRVNGFTYEFKSTGWITKREMALRECYTNEVVFVPMLGSELMGGKLRKRMEGVKVFNVGGKGAPRTRTVQEQMQEQILVNSQCAYVPVITLKRLNEENMWFEVLAEACFPETKFVTVTSYKSEEIRKLKREFNKYSVNTDRSRNPSTPPSSSSASSTPPALPVMSPEEADQLYDFFPGLRK